MYVCMYTKPESMQAVSSPTLVGLWGQEPVIIPGCSSPVPLIYYLFILFGYGILIDKCDKWKLQAHPLPYPLGHRLAFSSCSSALHSSHVILLALGVPPTTCVPVITSNPWSDSVWVAPVLNSNPLMWPAPGVLYADEAFLLHPSRPVRFKLAGVTSPPTCSTQSMRELQVVSVCTAVIHGTQK